MLIIVHDLYTFGGVSILKVCPILFYTNVNQIGSRIYIPIGHSYPLCILWGFQISVFVCACIYMCFVVCVCTYTQVNWIITRQVLGATNPYCFGILCTYNVCTHASLPYIMLLIAPNRSGVPVRGEIFPVICVVFILC